MTYVQVLTPNPAVPCTPGWCLKYVSDAFGVSNIPHTTYPSATAAWNASHQHADQDFPSGVWVPVWFSLRDEPAGHVALRAPDGSVWSSSDPNTNVPHHHPSLAALINYYAKANPLTYLGWSEDIGGTAVITPEGEPMPTISRDQVIWHYRLISGNEPTEAEIVGHTDKDYVAVTEELKRYFANVGAGYQQYKQQTSKQIADLNTQLADERNKSGSLNRLLTDTQAALKDARDQVTQAQTTLATEQAKSTGLAKNLDDSQLELKDAKDELAQADALAANDDATIKDLTAQLAAANSKLAEKPPAPSTSTSTSTPPYTAPQTTQTTQTSWLDSLLRYLGLK